ncbi:MAG: cell division protein ZapA [Candidatus Symbiothrix sp.]|jgi:cell division protein ZapA|nr:cell division protein ZapA [Candidatus Symbiothrix sp.]
MEDENFKIQLRLADNKHYPYTCMRSEEGIVRKAATNLNDMFIKYSSYYSNAGFQLNDILTLLGFHFSLEVLENEKREDMSPMFEMLDQLNKEMEEYIKSFQ